MSKTEAIPGWAMKGSGALAVGGFKVLTPEAQIAALNTALSAYLARSGGRVTGRSERGVEVTVPNKLNHVLHAVLSIFTFGAWLIVWALLALLGSPSRELVTVDEYGNVTAVLMPKTPAV